MNTCPVCNNSVWKIIYKIDKWDIKVCPTCKFSVIDPLPSDETRKDDYSKDKVLERNFKKKNVFQKFSRLLKGTFARFTKRNKSKIFFDNLAKSLPEGSKVLDIGCGDGSFLKLASSRFICSGIEISEYLANIAKTNKELRVITGNFLELGLGEEKFDGITLISLLEHISDPSGAITKCFDLLNNNGILLLKTVNFNSLNRIMRGRSWVGFRPPDHVVYFTPENISMLLKKIGFKSIKVSSWPLNDSMYIKAIK